MALQPNQLFAGRYRLLEEKGRGSFGEVWKAVDEHIDITVAIKIYIALDDRGVDEFKKEYKTAYELNHPNLLHANHFDIFDHRPYLVMPYCPTSATSLVGNCDAETLERFITDVAAGLAYLHNQDIVHHDIKPDNILMTEDGHFVITDFGISTQMRGTLRRNSIRSMQQQASGGAIPYMGPEMFSGKAESIKATDIWAFGATLYEIISGELPFFGQGGVMQKNGADIPRLDYPDKQVVRLVKACLAKDTWDRPMAENIVHFRKENPSPKPMPRWAKAAIAGVFVLVIIFGLVYSLWPAGWERDQKANEQAATECYELMQRGKFGDSEDLLEAWNKMEIIKDYEAKHQSEAPQIYSRAENLEKELTKKCEDVAFQYFEGAVAQASVIGDVDGAKERATNFFQNGRKLDISGRIEKTRLPETRLIKEGKISTREVYKLLGLSAK